MFKSTMVVECFTNKKMFCHLGLDAPNFKIILALVPSPYGLSGLENLILLGQSDLPTEM